MGFSLSGSHGYFKSQNMWMSIVLNSAKYRYDRYDDMQSKFTENSLNYFGCLFSQKINLNNGSTAKI